jgi:hypothetical protein
MYLKEMRPMDDQTLATHFKNLDRRLDNIEQILPALATRQELKPLATEEDLKPLATKEDLTVLATREELQATADTLRQEIREEGERLRRYMDVLNESVRGDVQLIAEHLASIMPRQAEQ